MKIKNTFRTLLILGFISFSVLSCSNNEELAIATAPTNGVKSINPSTQTILLTKPNRDQTAITFNWEKSDFGVSTPFSYTLEIDAVDGNFSAPETVVTEATQIALTHGTLNAMVISKKLEIGKIGRIKVRVKSSLNYGAVPSYSKEEIISVTPYLDLIYDLPASNELYLQGDAVPSNWGYPVPAAQKMTKVNDSKFSIIISLTGGKGFSFISSNSAWGNPAYRALDSNQLFAEGTFAPSGSMTVPAWGGVNLSVTTSGTYKVEIDFATGKYKTTRQ